MQVGRHWTILKPSPLHRYIELMGIFSRGRHDQATNSITKRSREGSYGVPDGNSAGTDADRGSVCSVAAWRCTHDRETLAGRRRVRSNGTVKVPAFSNQGDAHKFAYPPSVASLFELRSRRRGCWSSGGKSERPLFWTILAFLAAAVLMAGCQIPQVPDYTATPP